jgi:hypothetical protein
MKAFRPELSWTFSEELLSQIEFQLRLLRWEERFKGTNASEKLRKEQMPTEPHAPDYIQKLAEQRRQEMLEERAATTEGISREEANEMMLTASWLPQSWQEKGKKIKAEQEALETPSAEDIIKNITT